MRTSVMIMSFILFAVTVHSQNKSGIKLKTNAKDTLTLSEMFSTDGGLGDAVRIYKIVGRKFAYGKFAVDVLPEFPGGESDFYDIVYEKAKALYPEAQKKLTIEFVIDYDGRPTDFKFMLSKYPNIDRKLIKFIRSLGKWTPGIKDNKYVKAKLDFFYRLRRE